MASLHQQKGDRPGWKIRYRDEEKRPRVIWVGDASKKHAAEVFRHVDALVSAKLLGMRPDPANLAWARGADPRLRERLETLGLIDAATATVQPRTVLAYMRTYITSRTDWKKSCNHKQSVDHLERYLGRDLPLDQLTNGEAERFNRWMMSTEKGAPGLSPNTAGQHIKRCRQMMRVAAKDRLLDRNPFEGIKIDLRSDRSKNVYIDAAAAAAVLEACPDQEWRTLFSLARYGGLRCPSEVLGLRWSDIQWDRGRFKVRSPKTEKSGKAERIVPLFPELLDELNALYSLVAPGVDTPADGYVIARYRDTETNLRTTLGRISDRAGLARWPKPFMALRASRRTELERSGQFANHVLNEWFGHTGAIAEMHYLQVTEDDFSQAAGGGNARGNISAAQGPSGHLKEAQNTGKSGPKRAGDALTIHPRGFEPLTFGSVDLSATHSTTARKSH